MKALITGASSGIGQDMARYLASKGYDLILVARRKSNLNNLKKELPTNVKIIPFDLTEMDNLEQLYNEVEKENKHTNNKYNTEYRPGYPVWIVTN